MKIRKSIYLTFDDGPNGKYTAKILDILKKHNIKATFFLVGKNVRYYRGLAKRICREGHTIGNHGYDHQDFTKLSQQGIREQLLKTQDLIEKLTGKRPFLFRPPYLKQNTLIKKIAGQLGYKVILCDVDTKDWKQNGINKIIKQATTHLKNNSILLFHDGRNVKHNYDRSQTTKALPEIIKTLKRKGFSFKCLI